MFPTPLLGLAPIGGGTVGGVRSRGHFRLRPRSAPPVGAVSCFGGVGRNEERTRLQHQEEPLGPLFLRASGVSDGGRCGGETPLLWGSRGQF